MVKKKLVLYVALAALWGACGNDNESQPTAAPDGRTALTVKDETSGKVIIGVEDGANNSYCDLLFYVNASKTIEAVSYTHLVRFIRFYVSFFI